MHILYLEDNPLDANLTQFALKRAFDSLTLDVCHKLSDALGRLAQAPPPGYDLVITDLNLPDGSGLDLLSHIRSHGLPYAVIVVTGQMDEGTIISALKAGANDYIIKREDYLERLPATIENTLQRYAAEALVQKRPIKVVYADNNESDVAQTVLHLSKNAAHIQLDTVKTSRQLYRAVSEGAKGCDVILLDYFFAGLSGVEILKELEALHSRVPVVIVTGQGSEDIILQVTRLGAADYISKEPGYLFRLPLVLENAYHRWRFAQGQAALHSAEEKYRALVEQIPAAVYVALPDDEATTIFMSPQIEEICGYTPAEWLEKSKLWLQLIHPEDRERVRKAHLQTNQTGEPFLAEYRFVTKTGGIVWVRDQALLIQGSNGEPGTWQGFFQDITSKIKSELALKRQLQELSILHTIAKLSTVSTSIDEIIARTTQAIGEAFTLDNFGVLLYSAKKGVLKHHASYRSNPKLDLEIEYPLGSGITGTVAKTGMPWLVSDVRATREYIATSKAVMSELCVPIRSGEKLIGVLNAESAQVNFFTEDDLRLMVTIAGQLAAVIERNRLFEEERKRRQEAETLRQATAVISTSLELETVLTSMLDSVNKVLPFSSATIFLTEPDGSLVIVSEMGFPNNTGLKRINDKSELFVEIMRTRQPIILADAQADARFTNWGNTTYIRGWMGIPLIARDEVIGFLTIDNTEIDAYTPDNARIAESFGNQAAAAIHNARLYAQARQRVMELEVINKISATLRDAPNPESVMEKILDHILAVLNLSTGAVWLTTKRKGDWNRVAAQGWLAEPKFARTSMVEGRTGKLLAPGKPPVTANLIPEDQKFLSALLPDGWSGGIFPVQAANEQAGVFVLACQHPRTISGEEANLLNAITGIIGSAIHRAALYQQTEDQVRRLMALRDIDIAISSSFDLRVTLDILLDHTVSQLKVDAANVLTFKTFTQMLEFEAGRGFLSSTIKRSKLRLGEGYAGQVALRQRPLIVESVASEDNPGMHVLKEGFRFYAGIPLVAKGSVKGVLEVYKREPFSPDAVWQEFFEAMAGQAAIAIDNAQLFTNLQRSNYQLGIAYDTTLEGWGKALELRDQETEGHTLRVTKLTLKLAMAMGINDHDLMNIRRGALLHDIGKMGIPDAILHKPGPLSAEEQEVMKRHPQYAYDLLSPIEYLRAALEIPYSHHEKWDGSGYPLGLKEQEIPLSARIFAIIDVWDALRSHRPYRPAWPDEKVLDYIREQTGKQFDPGIVEVFMQLATSGELD